MQQQEEREGRQSEGDERKFAFLREEEGRLLELEVKAQNIIKNPPRIAVGGGSQEVVSSRARVLRDTKRYHPGGASMH